MSVGIACHQVEAEVEALLSLDRHIVRITLRHIVQIEDVGRTLHRGEHRTVVEVEAVGLAPGLACSLDVQLLHDDIVEGLRVDTLDGPLDAQRINNVDGEVCTELLAELEVLVEDVDGLCSKGRSTLRGLGNILHDVALVDNELLVAALA